MEEEEEEEEDVVSAPKWSLGGGSRPLVGGGSREPEEGLEWEELADSGLSPWSAGPSILGTGPSILGTDGADCGLRSAWFRCWLSVFSLEVKVKTNLRAKSNLSKCLIL